MRLRRIGCLALLLALSPVFLSATPASPAASATVAAIRKAGALTCGIDQSEIEFSMTDEHGSRVGFDTDLCRAVAVAILGRDARVITRGYPDDDTATAALSRGEVDMIASTNDDLTHTSDAAIGFTRPVLYDGRGFMVARASGIQTSAGLDGKKVCFLAETETEVTLRAWFAKQRLHFAPFPFQEEGEMDAAFVTGNCAALAGDLTRLANTRVAFGPEADKYQILPELFSIDPLAAAYRRRDPAFGNILDWTINILLLAEEHAVSSANAESLHAAQDPIVERLLGQTHELGRPLGLDHAWAAHVISATGNYGEIFTKDLGEGSPLKLARGPNALWSDGGMMNALPLK